MKRERVIRWFESRTLMQKFIAILVLLCAALFTGEYASRGVAYDAYDEQLYVKTAQVLTACAQQIEVEIEKIDVFTISVIGDEGVQGALMSMRGAEFGTETWREAQKALNTRLSNMLYRNEQFRTFCIMHEDGERYTGARPVTDAISLTQLYEVGVADEGMKRLMTVDGRLLVVREIRQTKGLALTDLGVMVGEIDVAGILQRINAQYGQVNVKLALAVYMNGECLYDDGGGTPLDSDGWSIDGDDFVVQSRSREWLYVVRTPYGEIRDSIHSANARSVALTVLIALAALLVCQQMIRGIVRHLELLVKKMDDYRKGVLPLGETDPRYAERADEIGRLHRNFDRMAWEARQLSDENYNRMLLLKEAQYRQLQAQIQPHFLFNTLSSIVWCAYRNEDEETAELTQQLSRVLRASMAGGETTVPLADELALIRDYMAIQQARYGERLEYSEEVGPGFEHTEMPRMTLQPIVENAIRHGLEQTLEPCRVRVYGAVCGENAHITIENNGSEIPPDILERLQNGKLSPSGTGVGLRNIQQRIQLAFSEEYGLQFASENGRTMVTVVVPLHVPKREKPKVGNLTLSQ